jgi:hypothetical protein
MAFRFRRGHPGGNLEPRAVRRDNGLRTIGAPCLARDGQRLTVERMKRVANRNVRTHGIVDGAGSIHTITSKPSLSNGAGFTSHHT